MELDIVAGRLYAGFDECIALRIYMESPDGAALSANPAGFLLEWLALRRKGQDIIHTLIGYVCQGWPLRKDHHPFAVQEGEGLYNFDPLVESAVVVPRTQMGTTRALTRNERLAQEIQPLGN